MMKELCEKVIEVRMVSDSDHSCSFGSRCAKDDLWVYSTT